MQQVINQILEGSYICNSGSLDFSCIKIELTVKSGENCEGTFHITSVSGQPVTGTVTTSDPRMECLTPDLTGSSLEMRYRFCTEELQEGEVVKGNFYIISNLGEYYLPFAVSVEHTILTSSVGIIRNLFHFANLAKTNWQEAVHLFYSPLFPRVLRGSEQKYYDSYRGLSSSPLQEQAVEEFLIQIHKKNKVEYQIEQEELTVNNPLGITELLLTVAKEGWGFTRLNIQVEGEFAYTEKTVLTDDEFLGNRCELPVFVDSSKLRSGKNYGRINLSNPYVSLMVPILVKVGERDVTMGLRKEKKRLLVQLMEFYQAFRLKKISSVTWLRETGRLVEHMVVLEEEDIAPRLFQAQLLITQERYQEANWLLRHAASLFEQKKHKSAQHRMDPILEAYYLYLTTLTDRRETYVDQVMEQVELIYQQNHFSWRIAWLLLYLSPEYNRNLAARWQFLEKQSQFGCASPVIYIEALLLLNHNPSLLRQLNHFSLQVLRYGAKQEMISQELVEQLLYLTGRYREYSKTLFVVLCTCYAKEKDIRLLQEICALLIKGGKTGTAYFTWYQQGIEQELRITKLYEYYMMSLDLNREQEIPKLVLMYFSYQNNLDYKRSAVLYDYLLRHKEEFPELYENYRERMEGFVVEQIQKEHINRHLADLYSNLLTPDMIGPKTAPALAKLLFANLIQLESTNIRNVIVYQPGNLQENKYPVRTNSVWIPLYGNEHTILLEDASGNRFTVSIPYTIEKLMLPGKWVRQITPYVGDLLPLNLYLCESNREVYEFNEESAQRSLWIAASSSVEAAVKQELCLKVLQYLYDHDDLRRLDNYLEQLPIKELNPVQRGEVLRYLVLREKYDMAYHWLKEYGPYHADPKTLLRLLGDRMQQCDYAEEELLLQSSIFVFQKGKYNSSILQYLNRYYHGLTKHMRDVWKAAKAFDVDCRDLAERLLIQMLYTGAHVGDWMEIFQYYLSKDPDQKIEEAFLIRCAYDYFVHDKLMDSTIFEEILHMFEHHQTSHKICRLAYLKYYAENPDEITSKNHWILEKFLKDILGEGIHLNLFRELKGMEEYLFLLQDKTIIEYHANSKARTIIHYVVVHEDGGCGDYLKEEMTPVFGGICFKEFVLFYGETLQYYIVEERNGQEELTQSGTIQKSDLEIGNGNSKYELLNDMVISKVLEDYDTLDHLLEEYYHKEYYNRNLFTLR